jgi:hypothetical protein
MIDRPATIFKLHRASQRFDGVLIQLLFRLRFADAVGGTPCLTELWKELLLGWTATGIRVLKIN